MLHINRYLLPLSALYGVVVKVRGWLFDIGLLKQREFSCPTICVGNLTVGGTGKTPHTEYLIRQLTGRMGKRVAVLSRGYGRKTRGFRLADGSATAQSIGDEPMQMHIKFPDTTVAVCEKRVLGMELLMGKHPDVVVLDDAFQHRYVKAGLNILLMDYNRPIYDDVLLPAGRLREPMSGLKRTHIVVVTKCPAHVQPIDLRVIKQKLKLQPWQRLFFTRMEYGEPYPLFADSNALANSSPLTCEHIMLLSGIAQPEHLLHDLATHCQHITPLVFADHHNFTAADAKKINKTFESIASDHKTIITTEKDAARLRTLKGLSTEVLQSIYVLPMQVSFLRDEESSFLHCIGDFIKSFHQ